MTHIKPLFLVIPIFLLFNCKEKSHNHIDGGEAIPNISMGIYSKSIELKCEGKSIAGVETGQFNFSGQPLDTIDVSFPIEGLCQVICPERYKLMLFLPHSLKININSKSILLFNPDLLDTIKLGGEAFIETSTDSLIIDTGHDTWIVVQPNTKINLSTYSDYSAPWWMEITVVEGYAMYKTNNYKECLKPSTRTYFPLDRQKVGSTFYVDSVRISNAISWVKHRFTYDNIDPIDLVYRIGRWKGIPVNIMGFKPYSYSELIPYNESWALPIDQLLAKINESSEKYECNLSNGKITIIQKK